MNNICLVVFFFCLPLRYAMAQNLSVDSIYKQFEYCIANYVLGDIQTTDSTLVVYYGSKMYPSLSEQYETDGKTYNLSFSEPADTISTYIVNGTKVGFFKGMPFNQYIDFVVSEFDENCPFAGLENGTWLYLNCPWELWAQFYFDVILERDTAYVTPFLDVITVLNEQVYYTREMIVCTYTRTMGFQVKTTYKIRGTTMVCK